MDLEANINRHLSPFGLAYNIAGEIVNQDSTILFLSSREEEHYCLVLAYEKGRYKVRFFEQDRFNFYHNLHNYSSQENFYFQGIKFELDKRDWNRVYLKSDSLIDKIGSAHFSHNSSPISYLLIHKNKAYLSNDSDQRSFFSDFSSFLMHEIIEPIKDTRVPPNLDAEDAEL